MTLREVELRIDRYKWEGLQHVVFVLETRGGVVGGDRRSKGKHFDLDQETHSSTEGKDHTRLRCSCDRKAQLYALLHERCLHGMRSGVQVLSGCPRGRQRQWQRLRRHRFLQTLTGAPVDAVSWKWEKLRPLKWQIFMSHCYRVFLLDIFYCNVGVEIQVGNFQIGSAFEDFQLHLMPDWLWLVLIMCWIFMSSVDAYSFCLMNDAVWLLKEYLQLLNIRIVNFCSLIFRY